MGIEVKKVIAADGSVTYTGTETTFVDDATSAILAPVSLFSASNDEFVSKKTAGMASIAWGAAGVVVGERWGQSRAEQGKSRLFSGGVAN
jgi:predicted alpha/beta hydrolase family esterase